MNFRSALLAYFASAAMAASAASGPQESMRLSIAHVPVHTGPTSGIAVVFRDEPLVVTVAINFVRLPNPENTTAVPATMELPGATWWNAIHRTLVDKNGTTHTIDPTRVRLIRDTSIRHPEISRPRSGFFIVEGERPEVSLNLGLLPLGDYAISARFLTLASRVLRFSARDGNETPELRRAFLHHSLETRPGTYDDAKRVLHELVTLEPNNAANFIQLGDVALLHGSADDAADAYARASALVADNKHRALAAHPATRPRNDLRPAIRASRRATESGESVRC